MTTYQITDAAALATVGLPAYMLGTWEHYNTQDGWIRLARKSGKGRAFANLMADDFAKGIAVGLFVAVA